MWQIWYLDLCTYLIPSVTITKQMPLFLLYYGEFQDWEIWSDLLQSDQAWLTSNPPSSCLTQYSLPGTKASIWWLWIRKSLLFLVPADYLCNNPSYLFFWFFLGGGCFFFRTSVGEKWKIFWKVKDRLKIQEDRRVWVCGPTLTEKGNTKQPHTYIYTRKAHTQIKSTKNRCCFMLGQTLYVS